MTDADRYDIAGTSLAGCAQLSAEGTRGGVLLFWDKEIYTVTNVTTASFSITAKFTERASNVSWHLTTVYGPADDERKLSFLNELVQIHGRISGPWMVIGDFNLILHDQDKNKSRVNRSWMRRFKHAVDSSFLREIKLIGRKYTWSNEQNNPTLVRLDRAFCNEEWQDIFQVAKLLPQASSMSDHCPLLLVQDIIAKTPHRFRFEGFWPLLQGYSTVVEQSWKAPCRLTNHFAVLDCKLRRLAKDLRSWAKNYVGDIKKQMLLGQEIMLRLDTAQETRLLSEEEMKLRSALKSRAVGLAVINRIKAKQRARIKWLKLGDANTKYFHSRATHRRAKNRIQFLHSDAGIATSPPELEETTFHHLHAILGTTVPCTERLDWALLDLPKPDLSDLDRPFTMEELKTAVFDSPPDKSPGPDGFSGGFFRASWNVVKDDLLAAINKFYDLNDLSFDTLNTAFLILLPKKEQPTQMGHFRPISLIHAFGKLVSKILALRLQPHLDDLISPCQSAFIAGRNIQDNFLYVQTVAKQLHKSKTPTLLLKLDIAKAFDSVSWTYIIDMLEARGFPLRWRNWISLLFRSASSRVLVNGVPGRKIQHLRGLRQGDALSPFLFDLAIDPLHRLLEIATSVGILSKLKGKHCTFRASFYADDVALFLNPTQHDISGLGEILKAFGQATGLITNLTKSSISPISCQHIDIQDLVTGAGIALAPFPCMYLGMPLSIKNLNKADWQALLDKMDRHLASWKARFMSKAGRLEMLNTVLTSLAVYMMTINNMPAWVKKEFDKRRRAWLWAGEANCSGGKCKAEVNQAIKIKEVLDTYASSTGQLINPGKCSVMFGDSCPMNRRTEVKEALQITQELFEKKYLGLPTPEGRMHGGKFESLQAKLAKCLVEWDDNHKSQAAKEVLIKSIAQAIPVYVMSVFKLPFGLCDELTKMIRRYWWGAENGKRKTHWLAWDIMLRPKDYGGVGFRDMRLFNQALLARQAWRLIQSPETLCAQLLKAKYYPNGSIMDTVFTGNGSSTWHAIEYGLQLLKKWAIWRVGNGASIRVWRDPWIPRDSGRYPRSAQGRCRFRWVSDFLLPDGQWNEQRLMQYFSQDDVADILKIKTSRRNEDDFIAWYPDKRDVIKGKMVVRPELGFKRADHVGDGRQKVRKKWMRPEPGVAKLNTDGAFARDGAAAGMVLRDHQGDMIFAACRMLRHCSDATEAELLAIEEGLSLALQWTTSKIVVESDCAEAIELIKKSTPNTSAYAFRVSVIRDLIQERDIEIGKVCREANTASHELAKFGRVQGRSEFWLSNVPQTVAEAMANDCNPPVA
ncbi:hypothetical protein QYE76_049035 [Lolium multiflorum]|uniref:Reverse transcriptase domain-containing protein n=1 Tax=Lolium multiflorum TaxID=4521 RepID=A0AAD8SP80_LOLMU|nr:hypothetical protein QYE76_049035 [Lolium multiflorum]